MLEPIEMAAAITTCGAIVTAAITAYMRNRELRYRLEQARHEITFQRDALDITGFIGDWSGFIEELTTLMEDTNIDRFLLLRAWNGALNPNYTSAVFQLHKSKKPVSSFTHTELDDDYVDRLRKTITGRPVVFKTTTAPENSLIRGIYDIESVTESMWAHIETLGISNSSAKAITYCSFSTTSPEGLSPTSLTRANLIVGRLKGVASHFTQAHT